MATVRPRSRRKKKRKKSNFSSTAPAGYDHAAHFQHAWSGETFQNSDWTSDYGGGLDVAADPGLTEGALKDVPIVRPEVPMHLH